MVFPPARRIPWIALLPSECCLPSHFPGNSFEHQVPSRQPPALVCEPNLPFPSNPSHNRSVQAWNPCTHVCLSLSRARR